MMSFNLLNKMACEEAYDNRKEGWCEDIVEKIKNEEYPFLEKELIDELRHFDLKGKTIAQFCCNNGREKQTITEKGRNNRCRMKKSNM